ncbi:MAG: gamma carbonic anhydrase family protein [Magnetococcales bacterium]|nr:gamma carbonic anhydrase family protein [Magnetococcales bacterium]
MPIYNFANIQPQIDPTAFIHPDAVVIGDVTIGPHSSVWPGVVIRGDVNKIIIGARTNIQDGSILHVNRSSEKEPDGVPLIIGDSVLIGHQVTLHACRIESEAMIGIGAVVLDRAVVGERAMLGAGSLLPPGKSMESETLWFGSPAKLIRTRSQEEIAATAKTIISYITLASRHQESLSG